MTKNDRVLQVYPRCGADAKKVSLHPPLPLLYLATALRDFEVTIFDLEGNLVRRLDAAGELLDNGTALWNGEDETGNRVGPGLYFFSARSSAQEATGLLGIKR